MLVKPLVQTKMALNRVQDQDLNHHIKERGEIHLHHPCHILRDGILGHMKGQTHLRKAARDMHVLHPTLV